MALPQLGNAADEATPEVGTPRPRAPFVPQRPVPHTDDSLLDAVRRGLGPGDPVALLLARWPRPTVRPIRVALGRPT